MWEKLSRETRGLLEGLYAARSSMALQHAAGVDPTGLDARLADVVAPLRASLPVLRLRDRTGDDRAPVALPRGARARDRAGRSAPRPSTSAHALLRRRHAEPARASGDRDARRGAPPRVRPSAARGHPRGEPGHAGSRAPFGLARARSHASLPGRAELRRARPARTRADSPAGGQRGRGRCRAGCRAGHKSRPHLRLARTGHRSLGAGPADGSRAEPRSHLLLPARAAARSGGVDPELAWWGVAGPRTLAPSRRRGTTR